MQGRSQRRFCCCQLPARLSGSSHVKRRHGPQGWDNPRGGGSGDRPSLQDAPQGGLEEDTMRCAAVPAGRAAAGIAHRLPAGWKPSSPHLLLWPGRRREGLSPSEAAGSRNCHRYNSQCREAKSAPDSEETRPFQHHGKPPANPAVGRQERLGLYQEQPELFQQLTGDTCVWGLLRLCSGHFPRAHWKFRESKFCHCHHHQSHRQLPRAHPAADQHQDPPWRREQLVPAHLSGSCGLLRSRGQADGQR